MRYAVLITSVCLLSGCATKTGTGALVGGGTGALIGGVAGGWEGAFIGGAVGALTGGLIGAYLDEQDQKKMADHPDTLSRMDHGDPITPQDVIYLHNSGVSDKTTLRYLKDKQICYRLNTEQKRRLSDAGLSRELYDYMTTTEC